MTIAFSQIPANALVPLFWAEIQPAQTPFAESNKLILVGHKWTTTAATFGLADLNKAYPLSGDNAIELFGPGSMLDAMYRVARANAPFAEIWGVAVAEDVAAVVADATIEVKADASRNKSGRLTIFIAGYPVSIVVLPDDTQETIAAKLKVQINRTPSLPCTAIAWRSDYPLKVEDPDLTKIRLLVKHKGVFGNDMRITLDRTRDASSHTLGERLLTITQFANGAGNPDINAALAALGDEPFSVFVSGWDNSAVLGVFTDFMDGVAGRWSPIKQLYGHVVACRNASYAALLTQAESLNDPHLTLLGVNKNWQPTYMWAAALGAIMNHHLEAPPEMSRPLQGLALRNIVAPLIEDRFDIAERNALHEAGIATTTVNSSGQVLINRAVTTYKYNAWDVRDASWRDSETMFQASYFVKSMRAAITGTFPRAALTDDDTPIAGFASPGKMRDLVIHEYKRLTALGLVENPDLFASALVVERSSVDANRMDFLMRPDLVNQLRICAVLAETHLQLKDSFVLEQVDVTEPEA